MPLASVLYFFCIFNYYKYVAILVELFGAQYEAVRRIAMKIGSFCSLFISTTQFATLSGQIKFFSYFQNLQTRVNELEHYNA
jgi:hypothetical protein